MYHRNDIFLIATREPVIVKGCLVGNIFRKHFVKDISVLVKKHEMSTVI